MDPTGSEMVEIVRWRYAAAECQNIWPGDPLPWLDFFPLLAKAE